MTMILLVINLKSPHFYGKYINGDIILGMKTASGKELPYTEDDVLKVYQRAYRNLPIPGLRKSNEKVYGLSKTSLTRAGQKLLDGSHTSAIDIDDSGRIERDGRLY